MTKYILIAIILAGIVIGKYVYDKKQPVNESEQYNQFLQVIMKAFNNILIGITDIPKIGDKTLVRLDNIDDLVDICEQVKKPIYYIKNENTCDFILINSDEYCIYTLKESELNESLFDKYYKDNLEKNKKENTKILEDLDKTTIIKIQDGSTFKVSPLRDRDLRKLREKKFLEELKSEVLPKLKDSNKEETV